VVLVYIIGAKKGLADGSVSDREKRQESCAIAIV
jgi:hypothetical protein